MTDIIDSPQFLVGAMFLPSLPQLDRLPESLPVEGAVRIDLEEGIPVFRASQFVQSHIEALLSKQRESTLSPKEEEELDRYEVIDDYLSLVNRTVRNLALGQPT
ncbi:hypothetical protein [Synechococcus sp. PCC 7336]|uniref:hypothetical protein n=1 Tax=Synechococcus sp. PCC 7336 TaxID=195250 RepID=UPI00034DA30D|nr:hypothetical protein [Synechococcus sp. PCC 7336]